VLDLSTSTFTTFPSIGGQVIRASADGSRLYGAALNASSGEVLSIDASTYAVQSEGFGFMFWSDLAVSPDGSQFAAVDAPIGAPGDAIGFFDSDLQYVNSNVYPDFSPPDDSGVLGVTFSPQGKVLVVPLGDSIELWDAAQGTLRARIMTPEELQKPASSIGAESPTIAVDSIGQTIYAVSASGLTVLTLPKPLDQMTPMQWPIAHVGTRQSAPKGLIASRMAAMRIKSISSPQSQLP
jgi:WD40 repeat protein